MERDLNKPTFIAEIASSHNGSFQMLSEICIEADKSKLIELFKIQIFKNQNLCHKSSNLFKILKKIEIKYQMWEKIIEKIKNKNKIIFEPFDEESLNFCLKFKKVNKLKIPSAENKNKNFILKALKKYKRVFFNISGFTNYEILNFIKNYKKYKNKLVIMYGFQSYPTNFDDLRFNKIRFIKKHGFKVGYADHTDNNKIGETYISTINALRCGASYIEKHVTPSIKKKLPDNISSFELPRLEIFIKNFLKLYNFNRNIDISNSERSYCIQMDKFAFTKKKVNKGEKIRLSDFKFLRSNLKGVSLDVLDKLIKKNKLEYYVSLKENTFITPQLFKKK